MSLDDFRAVFLPYGLEKQSDGRYVVLNREYKPVGFFTRERVTYADYPILVTLKITEPMAKRLSESGESKAGRIFLYNDATNPTGSKKNMNLYLSKIEALAKLRVT